MVDLGSALAPMVRTIDRRLGLRRVMRRCRQFFADSFRAEEERWQLWLPVLVGAGIGCYFALPMEPPLWSGPTAVLGIGAATYFAPPRLRPILVPITVALIGFSAAQVRTANVAAPTIKIRHGPAWIDGTVVQIERAAHGTGGRLLIKPISITYLADADLPERIRVTTRSGIDGLAPGDRIDLRAILMPPPEPAVPGGFDFARQAWYARLGGVGFALGAPQILERSPSSDLLSWAAHRIATLRLAYADHILEHVEGAAGSVVVALLTGARSAIPEDVLQAFRDSGIAHLLAISGLHMGLFAGALYWLVRLLLALPHTLALRYPIKKWAAGVAFLGATAYLALSGAAISTQRAYIMTTVMLFAVIIDRPAITMRNVALAALLILLWHPESLLHVGFQMSFAAVIALVAWFESFRVKLETVRGAAAGQIHNVWRISLLYLYGLAVTSLISGLATAPFAAYHFNRIAAFNLVADIGSMPIMVFAVMPAGLTALLTAPFGLDTLPLQFMGWAVEFIISIGQAVSSWPGAVMLLPSAPPAALVLAVAAGLWLCLWRTPWRRLAGLPALFAAALIVTHRPPDVFIEREGKNVAVRNASGELVLFSSRAGRFSTETWLRRDGDGRAPKEAASATDSVSCDRLGCTYREIGQATIAFANDGRALSDDCRKADIVVASIPVRGDCPSAKAVIDRFDLWLHGAHALWILEDGTLDIRTSADARGLRPWVQTRERG